VQDETEPGFFAPARVGAGNQVKGENMLAMLAAILIVFWLLGFVAFHITTGFIHLALVVGLIILALHFLRGGRAAA
jgi:Flp pilus assembly protein TadB